MKFINKVITVTTGLHLHKKIGLNYLGGLTLILLFISYFSLLYTYKEINITCVQELTETNVNLKNHKLYKF